MTINVFEFVLKVHQSLKLCGWRLYLGIFSEPPLAVHHLRNLTCPQFHLMHKTTTNVGSDSE